MKPRIGLALWSVRQGLADNRRATLGQVAAIGFTGVEPFGLGDPALMHDERIQQARDFSNDLKDAGLVLTSAHTRLPSPHDADWVFEELGELGSPVAVASVPDHVLGFSRDVLSSLDRLKRFADTMNALAVRARSHGTRIGYHNHWWDWPLLEDGRFGYDVLFELLDPDIVAEVDLYWARAAGRDPADVVARLGKRVELTHFKDGPAIPRQPQVPLGTGSANLLDALAASTASRWNLVELDSSEQDTLSVIEAGYAWLKQHMSE